MNNNTSNGSKNHLLSMQNSAFGIFNMNASAVVICHSLMNASKCIACCVKYKEK
jgi:hypothetical protein